MATPVSSGSEPIACDSEHCKNKAKYTVAAFNPRGGLTFSGKVVAVCPTHLPYGCRSVKINHPLFLVGEIE